MTFEIKRDCEEYHFMKFVESLGPETRRQFDQFDGLDKSAILELLQNRHNFYGMIGDNIVAYGFLQKFEKKHNVVSLGMVVSDKFQGGGYGRKMYEYIVDWGLGLGNYNKIWSAVYEDNERVLHIHKSLGFELEGVFLDELNDGRSIYSLAKFRNEDTLKRYHLTGHWLLCK